jgi:adenine-specific DNA-methyltransferase
LLLLKLDVHYIGIEQMQSQIDLSHKIEKCNFWDSTGISKPSIASGGSFTYLELKKYNQTFIDKILEAKDSKPCLEFGSRWK